MNRIPGRKGKTLFNTFINKHLPLNMEDFIYVEPFGGSFSVGDKLINLPKLKIYNDINNYGFNINADIIKHVDFSDIIDDYDDYNTFFYLDPPYFKKEYVYGFEHSEDFHKLLFNKLSNIKGKFLLSYEKNHYIENLYNDFIIIYNNDVNIIRGKEILIKNY